MKKNQFNICPTCAHQKTCVLTAHKEQVWECSEYDRSYGDEKEVNKNLSSAMLKHEPAMA